MPDRLQTSWTKVGASASFVRTYTGGESGGSDEIEFITEDGKSLTTEDGDQLIQE